MARRKHSKARVVHGVYVPKGVSVACVKKHAKKMSIREAMRGCKAK